MWKYEGDVPPVWVAYVHTMVSVNACVLFFYSVTKMLNVFRSIVATCCFTDDLIKKAGTFASGNEPVVTVQICSYNEASVIEDTIASACMVDWPKNKLCVQILDDSTDEITVKVVERACAFYRQTHGINVNRLSRPNREGRESKPFVGLVQTPWAYYNTHDNLITEADALTLDVHHVFEQPGRAHALQVFGYNGTGGVWRKAAIAAAGGWTWETVTEDLEISYKAFLAGYKLAYVRTEPQLMEVPSCILAHVQQKDRWIKGFFQVFRLAYWDILTSDKASFAVKFEAFTHMTGSVQYLYVTFQFILIPIVCYYTQLSDALKAALLFSAISPVLCATIAIFVKVPGSNGHYRTLWSRLCRVPLIGAMLVVEMGTSLFKIRSMMEGLFSKDATFLTTPKEGNKAVKSINTAMRSNSNEVISFLGLLLAIYVSAFMVIEYSYTDWYALVAHTCVAAGLFYVNIAYLAAETKRNKECYCVRMYEGGKYLTSVCCFKPLSRMFVWANSYLAKNRSKRLITLVLGVMCFFGLTQVEYGRRQRDFSIYLKTPITSSATTIDLPLRIVAFGTSRTWGVGCEDPERQAFAKLLSPTAKNMGIRATGTDLPSLCLSTMLEGDDDFDVILLEYDVYTTGSDASLKRLVQRVRHRFPHATIIFIRIRLLENYHHIPSGLTNRDWLMKVKGHSKNLTNIADDLWKTKFSDWFFYPFTKEIRVHNQILKSANVQLLEFPQQQFKDPRQAMIEYAPLYGPNDWYHISMNGHELLAQQIRQLLLEKNKYNFNSREHLEERTEPSFDEGDRCDNWMGGVSNVKRWTAGVVRLEHSSDMVLKPFVEYQRWNESKFALHVPPKGGYIVVENPFEVPCELYVNSMARSPINVTMYPKTLAKVDGLERQVQAMIEPIIPNPTVHVQVTTYIGIIPPGNHTLRFYPQDRNAKAPFRLTGIVVSVP